MTAVVVIAALALVALAGVRVVPENRRLAVFRLGALRSVAGPGLVLLVPFIDRGVSVFLDEQVPNWRALGKDELADRVRSIVLST